MSWLSRMVNVFRASKVESDIDEELRVHVGARVEDLIAQGMTREAAEAQAARQSAAACASAKRAVTSSCFPGSSR